MKCYFVYALPYTKPKYSIGGFFQRIRNYLLNKGLVNSRISKRILNEYDFKNWPIQSPYENAKHLYCALSKLYSTYFYHLTERSVISLRDADVFIGHPFFPIVKGNEVGVTEMALNSKECAKIMALISPLHCDDTINSSHINVKYLNHVNELIPKVDVLFAIMGEYWWDQWKTSKYAHWLPKMVRLDMAVNIDSYPLIKKQFNTKNKRRFFYIGKNDPMKGSDFLSELALAFPQFEFGWIGLGSEIRGVHKISDFRQLDNEFMSQIAMEYDFFISPSKADPNPTTILECMAWGFPVLCTPTSGYYENEYLTNITFGDVEEAKKIILSLQNMEESELIKKTELGRLAVLEKYNWKNFTDHVIRTISKYSDRTHSN
ncbi:hypothetical protein LX69_00830 [Breznakibacter xylanolyticus]|uniref:Glycosyltransferase involved in cell wall biosynthesis n=1 Tax=Breznakibacter xylanolyticus TaxID=990 RepID=A0A2W7NI88_9BACT|nr:glycosyltransferase [Breznakibacter xylanolyticus]PZX19163.1 hypothetical protein LX69_00830 [Breznakibacter xylanolyticus]